MTDPNIISFFPMFDDEEIDRNAKIQEYRNWLERHGDYGRLFMWHIPRPAPGQQSAIAGVRIYDPEVAILFCIMHGFSK